MQHYNMKHFVLKDGAKLLMQGSTFRRSILVLSLTINLFVFAGLIDVTPYLEAD